MVFRPLCSRVSACLVLPVLLLSAAPLIAQSLGHAGPPVRPTLQRDVGPAGNGTGGVPDWNWNVCPAPIGDLIVDGAIDPGQRGFRLALLGASFDLQSIGVRGEGPCLGDGTGEPGEIVADSSWWARAESVNAWVGQRTQAEPIPNVLEEGYATFWWDGYGFTVWTGGFWGPVAGGGAPQPSGDPPGQAVLETAIADLAPGLSLGCFYRRVHGGWQDLADLGIGDPRPAVPTSFSESYFDLQFLQAPPASCDPVAQSGSTYLSAAFVHQRSGYISISAYSLPEGSEGYPGQLSDWYLSWSNGRYQFWIWGDQEGNPIGSERLQAIARALDPTFSTACLLQHIELQEADLASHGFHAARPPAGYDVVSSQLFADLVSQACELDLDYRGSYSLWWSFENAAQQVIDASAYRAVGTAQLIPAPPTIGENYLYWMDALGTNYSVYGYSRVGGEYPAQALLIEVATSMDPTFEEPAGSSSAGSQTQNQTQKKTRRARR